VTSNSSHVSKLCFILEFVVTAKKRRVKCNEVSSSRCKKVNERVREREHNAHDSMCIAQYSYRLILQLERRGWQFLHQSSVAVTETLLKNLL
jgi:hypothetical protein